MAKGVKTGGRKKGTPNKITGDLRAMISQALEEAHPKGAVEYLKAQASQNPTAFLTLLSRTLPKEVNLNANGSLSLTIYTSDHKRAS